MPKKYNLRFIHCADIHLGHRQYGLDQRASDFAKSFEWLCDEAINNKVDFMIISGDMFDTRTLNPQTLEYAVKPLYKLQENNITIYVIDGNHDRKMYKDKIGWLEYLDHEGLIEYIKEYNIIVKEYNVISLGYNNKIDFDEITYFDNGFNIIMLHAGLEGIIPSMNGISKEEINKLKPYCDYLALGHIHKPYQIDDWIYNPGSLEHWSISESEWDGGYYLVSVDTNTKNFTTKHIPSPKRKMVRLNFHNSQIIHMLEECTPNVDDAIVELSVTGISDNKPNIDAIRNGANEIHPEIFYLKIVDKTKRPSSLDSEQSIKNRTDLERDAIDSITKDGKMTDLVLQIKKQIDDDPEELLEVIENV